MNTPTLATQIRIRKLPFVPWTQADVIRLLRLVAEARRKEKEKSRAQAQ